jgi:chromosome segregation ATPase
MNRRAVAAERSAQKLEAQQASALESQKKLQEQYDQERAKHAEARKEIQQASGQKRDVDGQLRNLQAALDKSKRETEAVQNARANVEKQLAQLNAQYVELQKERDERTKVDDRARTAFDNIMKTVGAIEDPAKKLDTLQKLSGAAAADLAGTAYRNRLDTEVARARDVLADHLAKAQKQEARAAKETYADAMRQAQMAATHDAAMEILAKAKAEVSGSPFELNIHNEMQRRADENVQLVAKNAYEQTMKQIRDKPIEYDANIAAINESMEKTKGTRYEALMQKQLTIVTGQRMEAIGKSYYTQAQAQIDKSPTDYASNVAVLRELVAKANGGRYEASIRKLLTKQEAYLAKSQKK